MPLGTEVGLGPGDTVLDAHLTPPRRGAQKLPHFSAHVYCGQTVPISATAKLLLPRLRNMDVPDNFTAFLKLNRHGVFCVGMKT